MTKSRHHGDNEYARAARQRAHQTGEGVCAILRAWRGEAVRSKDAEAERKIIAAEKYLKCRNRRKRSSK